MNHEYLPQKTIPRVGHKTRDAKNRPDVPPVSMKPLGFTIEFPGQKLPTNGNGEFKTETVLKDARYGREVKVVEISPLIKEPLTPLFSRNKLGGGTVGGGGTSKEALRRAKQKAKKPRK